MPPFVQPPPLFHLSKVETIECTPQTEIIFFDQAIDFIPHGAQILLGVFADPSGEGHLDSLTGVSSQIDADSGLVLNTLAKGQPTGALTQSLWSRTGIQLSLHIERHRHVLIPHLTITDQEGSLGGADLDRPWDEGERDEIFLPAFSMPTPCLLSAFAGYYSENGYRPEFGAHQMCAWPDDAP